MKGWENLMDHSDRVGPLETFDLNEKLGHLHDLNDTHDLNMTSQWPQRPHSDFNDLNGGDEFAKDDWIWWLQLTQWPQRRVGVTSMCPHSDLNVTSQWPQRPHNDLNDLNEMSSQKMTEFDDFNLLNDLNE